MSADGRRPRTPDTHVTTVSLPGALYEALRAAAFRRHLPMTRIIEEALADWLAREAPHDPR